MASETGLVQLNLGFFRGDDGAPPGTREDSLSNSLSFWAGGLPSCTLVGFLDPWVKLIAVCYPSYPCIYVYGHLNTETIIYRAKISNKNGKSMLSHLDRCEGNVT
jgi:hypothetical protein